MSPRRRRCHVLTSGKTLSPSGASCGFTSAHLDETTHVTFGKVVETKYLSFLSHTRKFPGFGVSAAWAGSGVKQKQDSVPESCSSIDFWAWLTNTATAHWLGFGLRLLLLTLPGLRSWRLLNMIPLHSLHSPFPLSLSLHLYLFLYFLLGTMDCSFFSRTLHLNDVGRRFRKILHFAPTPHPYGSNWAPVHSVLFSGRP